VGVLGRHCFSTIAGAGGGGQRDHSAHREPGLAHSGQHFHTDTVPVPLYLGLLVNFHYFLLLLILFTSLGLLFLLEVV